ncbi:MAG: hypothetical protein U0R52_10145 [Solirubrobacterales bacterium]
MGTGEFHPDHLCEGGLYFIEDWHTGYMPWWPDGRDIGPLYEVSLDAHAKKRRGGVRLPSHDYGSVGVAKRLLDHVASPFFAAINPDLDERFPIARMVVEYGLLVLVKPSAEALGLRGKISRIDRRIGNLLKALEDGSKPELAQEVAELRAEKVALQTALAEAERMRTGP